MGLIKELWRGEVGLSTTFWLYGFCVRVLFSFVLIYLIAFKSVMLSNIVGIIPFYVIILFIFLYTPYILIAIWRSSKTYKGKQRYAVAARIAVIFGWMSYVRQIGEFVKGMAL